MKKTIKPTSIRLDPVLLNKLGSLSKHIHRPRTWIIKEAVRYYLNDYADLAIALEKYTNPATEYLDWEKVKNDLQDKD